MNTAEHNTSNSHPSFFELDLAALASAASSETELHIERCGRCKEHVEDVTQREPLPQWVLELDREAEAKTISPWWKSGWSLWVTSFGAAAAVAATVMVIMPTATTPVEESPYVGAKGTPSVGVYVRRENRTFLHNVGDRLQVGDRLRLQVAPKGYSNIFVFSRSPSGELALLFRGPLDPEGNHLLPKAWEVDGSGTEETLVVALSKGDMDVERAREIVAKREDTPKLRKMRSVRGSHDLWVRTLVLPKVP